MDSQPRPIRTGMIRVENHAYWFAPQMDDDCDPVKLREASSTCHHSLFDPYAPDRMHAPGCRSFSIERIWDADRSRAETFSVVMKGKPKVCRHVEEVCEGMDLVYVNSCGSDGSEHLEFATPSLKAGIPTFVDKPLAFTYRQARAMQELSKQHKTPLMSSSLLSSVPEAKVMRLQAELLGGARAGYVRGFSGWSTPEGVEGIIHGLSLIQAVFGTGIRSVRSFGSKLFEYMVIGYDNEVEVLLNNREFKGATGMYVDVYTEARHPRRGDVRAQRIDHTSYIDATHILLGAVRDLSIERKAKIPLEHMIELICAIDAARISHRERAGQPAMLDDVRETAESRS